MSSIVNFDRDLDWFSLTPTLELSLETIWGSGNVNVTTDGVQYDNVATCNVNKEAVFSFTDVNGTRSVGVNLVGPDITGGSPYRVKGYAHSSENNYIIRLCFGVANSVITSSPNGDAVLSFKPIFSFQGFQSFDDTIYIPSFDEIFPGSGYSKNSLVVFCIFHRNQSVINSICNMRLSVQRLSVKPPAYITANR